MKLILTIAITAAQIGRATQNHERKDRRAVSVLVVVVRLRILQDHSASGNTTVVKSPKFGVLLHQPLLQAFEASFPLGEVNFIYGSGAKITPALMKSGNVDILALFGSVAQPIF